MKALQLVKYGEIKDSLAFKEVSKLKDRRDRCTYPS